MAGGRRTDGAPTGRDVTHFTGRPGQIPGRFPAGRLDSPSWPGIAQEALADQ